jgi:hypothetical protein
MISYPGSNNGDSNMFDLLGNPVVLVGIGVVLGWVVFPRPAWAQALYDKLVSSING